MKEQAPVDQSQGQVQVDGQTPVSARATANGRSYETASVYGSGGYATGNATTYSSGSVSVQSSIPFSERHPFFQSLCKVSFDMFGPDGKPHIGPDIKKLTLRIVTQTGELDAEFKLPSPKRKS